MAVAPERIAGDFGDFAAAEESFKQILDVLDETVRELDRELRSSLAQWTGAAAEAYWTAHGRWQDAASDMAGELSRLRTVVVVSRGNFARALAANLRMWRAG
ncbi:MAG TPA: WXG100 family type VII secretion target [Streptosporangiaceae bacterium]|nr:WXG100 family type VII secretion target [Streptosporangiaceae bacterium]